MNINDLICLSCEERYDYSLSTFVDEKEIWILVNLDNEFLKIYAEDDDFEYLPVWPSSELAENYANKLKDLKPKSIALPAFLKKWVTGLTRDHLEIGVFPGNDDTVWLMEPNEFKQDIQDELANF